MPQDEAWSWKKLFKGIFVGKNYGKAIVMMFCMAVILTICFSVYSLIKSKLTKPPQPVQAQTIGTNQGTVTTNNTTETKEGKSWSLINLLCKN